MTGQHGVQASTTHGYLPDIHRGPYTKFQVHTDPISLNTFLLSRIECHEQSVVQMFSWSYSAQCTLTLFQRNIIQRLRVGREHRCETSEGHTFLYRESSTLQDCKELQVVLASEQQRPEQSTGGGVTQDTLTSGKAHLFSYFQSELYSL